VAVLQILLEAKPIVDISFRVDQTGISCDWAAEGGVKGRGKVRGNEGKCNEE
jgi:hypothetical protein